jgi:SAM-dependent methyltransferase
MDAARGTGNEQAELWNGVAGHAWVEAQELLDLVLEPFEDELVQAVRARPRARVLDVGCGTGGVALAIERALGGRGRCVGVDISGPMVAAARERARREDATATFVQADAQRHAFEPASYDLIVSRFGVMFFDDPVEAFANLRRAAGAGAELCFVVWRSADENPFMTTAQRAAAPLLPEVAVPPAPDAPGQFAFADEGRVRRVLEEGGWAGIGIRPVDAPCVLPEKELIRYFTLLGPVGRALRGADDETRARVVGTVRAAFDPFVHGTEVRLTSACWVVTAHLGEDEEK